MPSAVFVSITLLALQPPSPAGDGRQPPPNRRQRRQHLQPPGTPPPPPAQMATNLVPAVLAGVEEDHSFEQYFFDATTRETLLSLLRRFERPLLVCAPSLAVAAHDSGLRNYLLLDRDDRFAFIDHFVPFELEKPSAEVLQACADFDCDVIFCDPPFANFELRDLRTAIDALVPATNVPIFLAFNGRREQALNEAFVGRQRLVVQQDVKLGYESVKSKTQQRIKLFGPPV